MGEFVIQNFFAKHDDWGFCSNFTRSVFKLDGKVWSNVEQYYQAQKYATGPSIEYANIIAEADAPGKARALGNKNLQMIDDEWVLNDKNRTKLVDIIKKYKDIQVRPDWNKVKVNVMIKGLIAKFLLPEFRKLLIQLPDNVLLSYHTTDDVWGDDRSNSNDKNYLGKILTVIAHVLKHGSCTRMSSSLKKAVMLAKIAKSKKVCIKKHNLNKLGYDNLREWMADKNNVYSGRHGRIFIDKVIFTYPGSKFANPYKVTKDMPVEKSLKKYRKYLNDSGLIKDIHELKGKNIGCFCEEGAPCHAQILAELANNT